MSRESQLSQGKKSICHLGRIHWQSVPALPSDPISRIPSSWPLKTKSSLSLAWTTTAASLLASSCHFNSLQSFLHTAARGILLQGFVSLLWRTLRCFPITPKIKSKYLTILCKALHDLPLAASLPSFSVTLLCSIHLRHIGFLASPGTTLVHSLLKAFALPHLPAWLAHSLQCSAQYTSIHWPVTSSPWASLGAHTTVSSSFTIPYPALLVFIALSTADITGFYLFSCFVCFPHYNPSSMETGALFHPMLISNTQTVPGIY